MSASDVRKEKLSAKTLEQHEVLASLIDELEAVDEYAQQADRANNAVAKAIFLHNRDEEIKHAIFLIEHLRQTDPMFAKMCDEYMYKTPTQLRKALSPE